jgi:hypothetical protein
MNVTRSCAERGHVGDVEWGRGLEADSGLFSQAVRGSSTTTAVCPERIAAQAS